MAWKGWVMDFFIHYVAVSGEVAVTTKPTAAANSRLRLQALSRWQLQRCCRERLSKALSIVRKKFVGRGRQHTNTPLKHPRIKRSSRFACTSRVSFFRNRAQEKHLCGAAVAAQVVRDNRFAEASLLRTASLLIAAWWLQTTLPLTDTLPQQLRRCVHRDACVYVCACVCGLLYVCVCMYMCTYVCVYICAYVFACVHICIYIYRLLI